MKAFCRLSLVLLNLTLFPILLSAQSSELRLANLEQDVSMLRSEMGKLRIQMEELKRENQKLRNLLANKIQNERSTAALAIQLRKENKRQNEALLKEVNQKLEALAEKTRKAMETLAKSVNASTPTNPVVPITFSNDYPKTGIVYTIKSGDTLSGIAKQFKSSVKDIQNANKITDPTRIQVGESLFIPQKEDKD